LNNLFLENMLAEPYSGDAIFSKGKDHELVTKEFTATRLCAI
jgi:hypothetical protein